MRSLRAKLLGWFGLVLVPVVAMLACGVYINWAVGRGVVEARAADELAHTVRQVMQWSTDYSLTWRPESLKLAEQWAARYREQARHMRAAASTAQAAALDRLERDFAAYWSIALEMANAYITFDRVVGNSFTQKFHAHADALETAVATIKDDGSRRIQAMLTWGTTLALAAGLLIVGVVAAGAFLVSAHLVRRIKPLMTAGREIASGNLTVRVDAPGRDEIAQLANVVNDVAQRLEESVEEVARAATTTATAARRLTSTTSEVAAGSQAQVSSLAATVTSLDEMTAIVKRNADSARQAAEVAGGSRDAAERGGQVVSSAVASMHEITRASKRIADIISVIDEIAFQTNLLALNAAVEAARAGDQGRGFAVVAAEVRNLAQRSAGSAKEIKTLIQDSVAKVEEGSALVDRSGKTLEDIVRSAVRVADIVAEIASACHQQSGGIDQINRAVAEMDRVTRENVAQTDELSATSHTLATQAHDLLAVVGRFTLADGRQPVAGSTTPRDNETRSAVARVPRPSPQPEVLAPR